MKEENEEAVKEEKDTKVGIWIQGDNDTHWLTGEIRGEKLIK